MERIGKKERIGKNWKEEKKGRRKKERKNEITDNIQKRKKERKKEKKTDMPAHLQKGVACDHSPASVHLMMGSPMRTNPSVQMYWTVWPTKCLPPSKRRPLAGGRGPGHWMAAAADKKRERKYITEINSDYLEKNGNFPVID